MHLKESVLQILHAFCISLVVWVNVGYFSAFERVSAADFTCFLHQSVCVGKCRLSKFI